MKVAITSMGNTLNSLLDKRFARCPYFAVYDTETHSVTFVSNPAEKIEEGAGPSAVNLMNSLSIKRIISGEFGLKIKFLLTELKIQLVVVKNRDETVSNLVKLLNKKYNKTIKSI